MAKKTNANAKKNWALPIAAAVVLLALLAVLLWPKPKAPETDDLTIPVSEIAETARFYPVTIDGTAMEVLAIRTAAGEIRTAFNTCQSCFDSGRGYYEADGTELVCQNCGFHFTAEEVGASGRGGCNPWPILPAEREETDDAIVIPHSVLADAKDIFANWGK